MIRYFGLGLYNGYRRVQKISYLQSSYLKKRKPDTVCLCGIGDEHKLKLQKQIVREDEGLTGPVRNVRISRVNVGKKMNS